MKAVRLVKPGRPLAMQEIPVPPVGPRDVLVRVKAAGVCHSDVHYRAGVSPVEPLPLTLGHEVAGVVERVGQEVVTLGPGDRVVLHYMVTCGDCAYCSQGNEQFCTAGQMLGKYRDGGYAEYVVVPARSAFSLPEEISFEYGSIMMCSSATVYHALRKGRLKAGETVAVYGVGGLGMSAVQLAQVFGALEVYAVDINADKLRMAQGFGAVPVHATEVDPVVAIHRLTGGRGVDVALELVGLPSVIQQAVASLAILGRAVMVGLTDQPSEIATYRELICKEAELIGSSDHLAQELPALIELARRGRLDLSGVVTGTLPLEAGAINEAMDRLERYSSDVRLVITP
jgi:2-desacetyl-2-hydroxyethyl bacteriochlorophyllide A dehydrogenase